MCGDAFIENHNIELEHSTRIIPASHNDTEYESELVPEESSNGVSRSLDQLEQENTRKFTTEAHN